MINEDTSDNDTDETVTFYEETVKRLIEKMLMQKEKGLRL